MIDPVTEARLLPRQLRQLAVKKRAEAFSSDIDVRAVAEHEVHRNIEHVVAVALVSEAILKHERQHSGAVCVRILPDVATEALVAIGTAFGEGRVSEQGGGDRLQREPD